MAHRFNGAALVRVRKCAAELSHRSHEEPASMGPHSFECGNIRCMKVVSRILPGFNGAALVRVRKSAMRLSTATEMTLCFNGAALVRVRKY